MKRIYSTLFLLLTALALAGTPAAAQSVGKGYYGTRSQIIDGDTILVVDMLPIKKYAKAPDMRKHARLVRNVKIAYPIAREAMARLTAIEEELLTMESDHEQKKYIKAAEKALIKEYTPVLKQMTFSQGKILIKLIDRETEQTSYAIVKELRGGLTAAFWQGIARIFGANLKDTYDKKGEDQLIEQIITLYEAGLI